MSEMKEKLHTGELYLPGDEEIMKEQMVYQDRLCDYNMTKPSETEKRTKMLKEMLGDCGEGVYIEAPFYANFGGHHCHFGKMVYANYHLTCVDDTHIYIGDYTMIGPNVTIATAGHPILPELREQVYQFNMPVHIGRNCWLGAGVIIMPGVTIGDNTVIGAGSVVTKDIPANVVAVGNPCRVMREISEHDNPITQAVRLAPSSLNSQPWNLAFKNGKIIIHDAGRGMKRIILKNKLNKIDVGIAARHAVLALENEGNKVLSATPITDGKEFSIEISYS